MQELRLVLIIVGALAIAALLFHGLWTSKKEGKSKFSEKSVIDSDRLETAPVASDDDFDVVLKEKSNSAFGVDRKFSHDPLGVDDPLDSTDEENNISGNADDMDENLPKVSLYDDIEAPLEEKVIFTDGDDEIILKPKKVTKSDAVQPDAEQPSVLAETDLTSEPILLDTEDSPAAEEELQVIVINVHCAGDEPFIGTKLFDSMQQNGLLYGEMDIFHRHNDMSGTGKVLFSVANMMDPGTLKHDDPATFATKGISFFMTLPCFGEADQNFKVMLRTAQQIADDLGGNVLDEQRNLMTPDKLASFRNQIRAYKSRNAQKEE